MAVPIRVRLFLFSVAAMVAVGAIGLVLIRWSFTDARLTRPDHDPEAVALLGTDLGAEFDLHGGWRFVPPPGPARGAWLRSQVARSTARHAMPDAAGTTLADRLALTDASGQLLAGVEPAAALVAIASIDRRRWTIPSSRGVAGYLTLAMPRDPADALAIAFLMQRQRSLGLWLAIAFALLAIAAAVVAASFRRPLRALVEGARRLGRGELGTRIDGRRGDELGELARSFNELGVRLQSAEQSRRQWVAATSHELRTPLAVLKAQVEAMQDGIRPVSGDGLRSMAVQIASLETMVGDLDQLARGDIGTLQMTLAPLDLWDAVRSTWDDFAGRLHGCDLSGRLAPPVAPAIGLGDAVRLRQVLRNLLENSARYTSAGGQVVLSGVVDGAHLRLQLDDSAPAVAAVDLVRLGERFFRVDPSRSREHGGSGLGLALARQIVEAHHGRLEFAASPLGGLRASMRLPLGPA